MWTKYCSEIYVPYALYPMTFLMRVQSFKIKCSIVFHNLYNVHAMKYISLDYLAYSSWRYLAFQMGTIKRLLCVTFMTSQSHLWRYCCMVMSRGLWLLRRCCKRGFGDHRKQPIYEFNWIVISIEIQLTKTANRMAKIIILSVCK